MKGSRLKRYDIIEWVALGNVYWYNIIGRAEGYDEGTYQAYRARKVRVYSDGRLPIGDLGSTIYYYDTANTSKDYFKFIYRGDYNVHIMI